MSYCFSCDVLNEKDTNVFVDLIDACETLRKELLKSLKIAKKFKEELKLANLEKEELIVRLDEYNLKEINFWEINFPLKMERWKVWNKR